MTRRDDRRFMARALQLAARGLYTTDPNPRVGCVLVKAGAIVGEGFHARAGGPHAEVYALRDAGSEAREATAYVTLEPCCHHGRTPPCTEALIEAGVTRVVVAMRDPNTHVAGKGLAALRAAGIEVEEGLLAAQAQRLNPGFISRMAYGRPWVRIKSAISLDGRTALADGQSKWITGEAARRDVQFWRARSAAIMTGSGTVLADDPRLDVRLGATELGIDGDVRQPTAVILDTALKSPPAARLLTARRRCAIFTACDDQARIDRLRAAGAEIFEVNKTKQGIDLTVVMDKLAHMEINEIQVEAGPALTGSLIGGGFVDQLVVYLAPHLIGDAGRGLAHLPGLRDLRSRVELRIDDITLVGNDLRLTAAPAG
ncbi:MAG: bifunctional diaminohydroxyphosphoribosylaminopyrimidine deaminase/5-amino-6-(5-phosphoribosylamino)uracil reductase RibD [Gammaproteobacteria bacterium]